MTSTPKEVEAIGGDELLYLDGERRSGGYATIRTRPTREFAFALVGSLTDAARAKHWRPNMLVGSTNGIWRANRRAPGDGSPAAFG